MEMIGKGGECKVWKTADGIFKEYETKSEAEGAYYWQWELSRWNLAPEVYTRVKRIRINGELSGWGYYTEQALTFTDHEVELYLDDLYDYDIDAEIDEVNARVEDLFGHEYTDFHMQNYGYVEREGEPVLVIIDTTMRSFCDITEMETV